MAATVADALIDRLVAAVPNAVKYDPDNPAAATQIVVYDNEVPDTPHRRYFVLYCGLGVWRARTYKGVHRNNTVTFQLTTVAADQSGQMVAASMCRWLEKRGIDALLDWKPTVAGLTCSTVRMIPLDNWPARDEHVLAVPTVYAVDRFTLRAYAS